MQKISTPALMSAAAGLVLALLGGSLALSLPKASVGAHQIQNDAVRSRHIKNGEVGLSDLSSSAKNSLLKPRGYARVRVIGVLGGGPYWDMAIQGPSRGFLSARTPAGGVTCLKPDPKVLTLADVWGGLLQDASGNDTRLYFDGSFGCDADEVRVIQKFNLGDSLTNQDFNILVP